MDNKPKLNIAAISSQREPSPHSNRPDEKSVAEELLIERLGQLEKTKHKESLLIKDIAGASGGALLGASVAGPLGALAGALLGSLVSYTVNHDKK